MNSNSSYTCSFLLALKERNQRKARFKRQRDWSYSIINFFDAAWSKPFCTSCAASTFELPVQHGGHHGLSEKHDVFHAGAAAGCCESDRPRPQPMRSTSLFRFLFCDVYDISKQ
jgi:hypothetical protein